MPDRRFPILGTSVPPMLGREAIVNRMIGALTKATPDHLQIVGPRFAGKTVILHELARRTRVANSPYTAVLLWDLGHQIPGTDEIFMQRFAGELSLALGENHSDYANYLRALHGNPYQDIGEVLELLKDGGGKVLAIMDGFDKPLSNGKLTRNLWDQLRELALKSSLRLVTASRRTLRDLIRNPEAQTSDFWNIFDPTPVRVGCFDEKDIFAVLETLNEFDLSAGAQTELWNASNGFPVVTLDLLNVLCERGSRGSISDGQMREACDSAFPVLRDTIDSLWRDCTPSCQDLLRRILEKGPIVRTGISNDDADALIERGFVNQSGNKLQRPNRLLERFLKENPNDGNALVNLFGDQRDYLSNMRRVLERRIAQIGGIDRELLRYLELGVRELPEFPKVFFSNIRGIIDRAMEIIWNAELDQKRIPSEWISVWRYNGEGKADEWLTRFPTGGQRLRLLDLMTGTQRCDPCAKYVSKSTYVLANAVQGFGDFGQHQEGAPIDPGTAYAALLLCIELASALTRECRSKQPASN